MQIVVLNGSPKGKHSITLQSVNFLQKRLPDVEFDIVHVAQRITRLENDEDSFAEVIEAVRSGRQTIAITGDMGSMTFRSEI